MNSIDYLQFLELLSLIGLLITSLLLCVFISSFVIAWASDTINRALDHVFFRWLAAIPLLIFIFGSGSWIAYQIIMFLDRRYP